VKDLFLLFLLTSCAGAQYQEFSSFSGKGYKNSKIGEDTYTVFYQGDGKNTPDIIYQYFLRRSAEIAKENGKKYYCIKKDNPGNFLNGIVYWPNHNGVIQVTNKKDSERCKIADEILLLFKEEQENRMK